jgi:hypothetical protein
VVVGVVFEGLDELRHVDGQLLVGQVLEAPAGEGAHLLVGEAGVEQLERVHGSQLRPIVEQALCDKPTKNQTNE